MVTCTEGFSILATDQDLIEKRRYDRRAGMEELSVTWNHGGQAFISRVYDLSLGGALIQSAEQLPLGTTLKLLFRVAGNVARARAVVRRSAPGEFMGVEFVAMEQEDRALLALAAASTHELAPIATIGQPKPGNASEPPLPIEAPRPQQDIERPPAERRSRRRSNVTAQVQVTEVDSGRLINAHLGSVSAGGCFLELEPENALSLGAVLTVAITRGSQSFLSPANVMYVVPERGIGVTFTTSDPQQLQILTAWVMETAWFAADRRTSQRIALNVPVTVSGINGSGCSFTEEALTVRVSADGCSLLLSAPLNKGQRVSLLHGRTKAVAECMIIRTEQSSDARLEIGMAFLLPNRQFWQVNFPRVE